MRITEFPIVGEIKNKYENRRKAGSSREQAVSEVMESYKCEIEQGSEDDGLLFWIGLADAQYSLKEISKEVAQKALASLNAVEQMDWDITPGDTRRRKERYAAAPMPEKTKFGPSRKFRCSWKIGDTFAYQMRGPEAAEFGLLGKYMLLRKVDEEDDGKDRIIPVVTISLCDAS